jgi:RHS repeat-associated protein
VRYYPFGETRYSSGNTSTTKRFNAKEQQTDIGLYDYDARFYDPAIGRFVSADSVVPKPGDPQNLNRYGYTRNNPFIYIDPSGHLACPTSSDACKSAAGSLHNYAEVLKQLVSSGKMKPVEALASLSDKALGLYENDMNGYMWGMTNVLLGIDPNTVPVWERGRFVQKTDTFPGQYLDADPGNNPSYIGTNWLAFNTQQSSHDSQQGDWLDDYFDGTSNQAFHFWFYAAVSYYNGPVIALAANAYHDPYYVGDPKQMESWPILGSLWFKNTGETSRQDYQLGVAAVQFVLDVDPAHNTAWGTSCSLAYCSIPTSANPSTWIKSNLQK